MNTITKNLSIAATVITALIAVLNYTYNAGRTSMAVEIQAEHNVLIQEQQSKYTDDLQYKVEQFNKAVLAAQIKSTEYYESLIAKRESDLIAEHETQLKIAKITHEASNITDTISLDSLRLFQQATGIIEQPAHYTYPITQSR